MMTRLLIAGAASLAALFATAPAGAQIQLQTSNTITPAPPPCGTTTGYTAGGLVATGYPCPTTTSGSSPTGSTGSSVRKSPVQVQKTPSPVTQSNSNRKVCTTPCN